MSKIAIALTGKHKFMLEAIQVMLQQTEDFNVVGQYVDYDEVKQAAQQQVINILIVYIDQITEEDVVQVQEMIQRPSKFKVLVVSSSDDEKTVYQIIKAGAKGFLSKDTSRLELIEAVYSLRSGHDFFSRCITNILLGKYVNLIQTHQPDNANNLSKLSAREVEIIKLWGESYTNQEIADKLFISIRTVESHKTHIMQKLNFKTTVDMVKYAIRNNIIEI